METLLHDLLARVEALEAQANPTEMVPVATVTRDRDETGNYVIVHDTTTPPPVATDEELKQAWFRGATLTQGYRALYNLGVAHGQASSQEVAELRAELERERLRLAACGVVAKADTPESAKKARDMHPDYHSASLDDVISMVDALMAERAKQAHSREVAEPAPVAGEMAELVADLRIMASQARVACQFSDGETLNSAANTLQRLSERLPDKDGVPELVAGGLVERLSWLIAGFAIRFKLGNDCKPAAVKIVLEVATWLREQGWVINADLLEQEAGR